MASGPLSYNILICPAALYPCAEVPVNMLHEILDVSLTSKEPPQG